MNKSVLVLTVYSTKLTSDYCQSILLIDFTLDRFLHSKYTNIYQNNFSYK